MNGPGPAPSPWLAALGQGLGIAPTAPPAPVDYAAQAGQALGMGPPQAAPAPVTLGGRPLPPDAPAAGPPPPPGAQIPLDGGMSKMPPPEPARSEAPPPPPAARPTGPQFPLMRSGAAGVVNVPAKETEMRGPTLLRAQDDAAEAVRGAVDAVNERSATTAAVEFAQTLDQQRRAQAREDAMNYSANERQDELEQRQNDFDQSVQALSKMSVDPDRFWASRSTGQKVAGVVSLFLGGFLQGMRGGPNAGLDMLNQYIDRDIEAQKFAYGAARDTAQQQQTAFGMAMQKYGNVDAAKAAARAAALDSVQAQLGQQAAMWKSADAANRAQMAMAELAQLRMQQIQQGVAFMPARQVAVGPTWTDPNTGLSYNDAQAREFAKEVRGQEHDLNKGAQGIGGDILKEGYKAQAAAAAKGVEHQVQLPTGEVIAAPDADTAKQLRGASVSLMETQRLTDKAKQILASSSWRADPDKRATMKQVQTDLMQNYGVAHQMGALSDKDYENAMRGTVDLFSLTPGKETALDGLNQTAAAKLGQMARTVPGAPAKAAGKMPGSTEYHGK